MVASKNVGKSLPLKLNQRKVQKLQAVTKQSAKQSAKPILLQQNASKSIVLNQNKRVIGWTGAAVSVGNQIKTQKQTGNGNIKRNNETPSISQKTNGSKFSKVQNAGGNVVYVIPKKSTIHQNYVDRSVGVTIKTAEAIAKDGQHPNRVEVSQLLSTFQKGWIDSAQFSALLLKYI